MYSEEGPRTNSTIGGWHSKVKKIAGKNHLNICEIVELFKGEQASTEVELEGPERDRHHVEEIKTLESKPL